MVLAEIAQYPASVIRMPVVVIPVGVSQINELIRCVKESNIAS